MAEKSPWGWPGPERRVVGIALAEIESHIAQVVAEKLEAHEDAERRNLEHLLSEMRQMRQEVLSAFPDNDPKGHEEFHREAIKVIRDLRGMLTEVRNKTVVGLVWALMVFLGAAVWHYAKAKMGIPE